MYDLLLSGGTIITCNNSFDIIEDGIIGVKDNKISLIESKKENINNLPESKECIKLDNEIVIPGLINAHCHAADSLFRGLVENLSLEDWLQEVWKAEKAILNPETTLLGSYLGLAENLLAGVTTVVDMFWYPFETANASLDLGLRLCTGGIFIDFPGVGGRTHEQYLVEASDFCSKFNNSEFIIPAVMPHGSYTVGPEHLQEAKKIASDFKAIFSIHAAETIFKQKDIKSRYGNTVIRHLDKLGLLDEKALLAHCVHLDNGEMDIIKATNSVIAHNPLSNLKLGSGIAPTLDFLEKEINVTLGTDGAISGNDLDMWLTMRLAATLPKGKLMKPDIVTAKDVFQMATINGAKALGKSSEIGSLEIGKQADMVIISANSLHSVPLFDPLTHLVYSCSKSDVKHVYIAGKQCVKDGSIINFDIENVIKELNDFPGVIVQNDNSKLEYPMPYFSREKDEVFVGRIRKDYSCENSLNLWIVADNLRKGAATNTVQIASHLIKNNLIS